MNNQENDFSIEELEARLRRRGTDLARRANSREPDFTRTSGGTVSQVPPTRDFPSFQPPPPPYPPSYEEAVGYRRLPGRRQEGDVEEEQQQRGSRRNR